MISHSIYLRLPGGSLLETSYAPPVGTPVSISNLAKWAKTRRFVVSKIEVGVSIGMTGNATSVITVSLTKRKPWRKRAITS